MGQLQDKVALVTGGNSGIGLAVARRFAHEGAQVVITGRRAVELEAAASNIGSTVTPVAGDLTSLADQERLFAEIQQRHGRLDVLVTSAGVAEAATLSEASAEHFDKTFVLNVRSTFFVAQRATALMGQGGTVVLIGSIAGFIGTPGYGAYGASKAAVRSFARTWTNELAKRGVRVNTLSPGPIDTPMFDAATSETRAQLAALIPLGRLGRPEEVAAAALFLASEESSFIAGAELCIDGGMAQV